MPFKRSLMTDTARELRQKQTPAEKELWPKLRRKLVGGYKFRRQHPIKFYVVDFCCPELNLIIELDGSVHDDADQKFQDTERETTLMNWGYRILRFKNREVLGDLDGVLGRIGAAVSALSSQPGSNALSPLSDKP